MPNIHSLTNFFLLFNDHERKFHGKVKRNNKKLPQPIADYERCLINCLPQKKPKYNNKIETVIFSSHIIINI